MTSPTPAAFGPVTLERMAELTVGLGANVQPGQMVSVFAELGHEELVRAIAAAAFRRGASEAQGGEVPGCQPVGDRP